MNKNRKPDYIDEDGNKSWYDDHYEFHNVNGYPAMIFLNGTKAWYKHGQLHNEVGPAIIYSWGEKSWFINGKQLTEKEFLQYKIKNFINE